MDRGYVESLWQLFRRKHKDTYDLGRIEPEFFLNEQSPPFPAVSNKGRGINAFQSHSSRSAWIFSPWKDGETWYTGFEYKGIGEAGGKVRRFAKTAWGGVYKEPALYEHRLSKMAFEAGACCQRPLAVYDYGGFYGKKLAVLVRTFTSPIRLSDFLFDRPYFRRYLDLRGESEVEYCDAIARIIGKNVRLMLDKGIYHGSMDINNITSEGEIADFEPTYGGTWEGVMMSREPLFTYMSIRRALKAGKTTFPKQMDDFSSAFSDAFFGRLFKPRTDDPGMEIAEKYCGTAIDAKKEEIMKGSEAFKVLESLRLLKKNAKTRKEKQVYDYAIKTITDTD